MVGDGGYDPADNVTAFAVGRFIPNSYVSNLSNYPLSGIRIGGCIIYFIVWLLCYIIQFLLFFSFIYAFLAGPLSSCGVYFVTCNSI
jgi:hypothetical protein